jgi:hypothetical protein
MLDQNCQGHHGRFSGAGVTLVMGRYYPQSGAKRPQQNMLLTVGSQNYIARCAAAVGNRIPQHRTTAALAVDIGVPPSGA